MQNTANCKVGIDIGHKSLVAIRYNPEGNHERFNGQTTHQGLLRLAKWLRSDELVGIEAGSQSFRIQEFLKGRSGCKVIVLNPGDIQLIYRSLKKTDKEDALKIARLLHSFSTDELPVVHPPDEVQVRMRMICSEQENLKKTIRQVKNRVYNLCISGGHTGVKSTDYTNPNNIRVLKDFLPIGYSNQLERLALQLELLMDQSKDLDQEMHILLREKKELAELFQSMPGVGPKTALALVAYLGDCRQFTRAGQVSYYAGLVPKIDISGKQVHHGHIIKRGCRPIRRLIVQAAWALVRSKDGGELAEFYFRLSEIRGKKRAIVATARKMLEVIFSMTKSGNYYCAT